MAKQVLTNLDFINAAKIVNLPDPTAAQDAATKNYVDVLVEGIAWKDNVKVASTVNITISAPGATIDGITMVTNDRFLAKDQTVGSENGIYIWNGAAVVATRAPDANLANELLNATVSVDQGTANGGTTWRQSAINITLGTTSLVFGAFGVNTPDATTAVKGKAALATQVEVDAGTVTDKIVTPQTLANYSLRKLKFSQNIGDGTSTQITVTHNLGTQDLNAIVRRTSGAFDEVICDIEFPTVNTCIFRFATAPAAAAFRAIIGG
jgi:hypothetical protein